MKVGDKNWKCEDCRWFADKEDFVPQKSNLHICRRKAPSSILTTPTFINTFYRTLWPYVSPDDWCGEFKRKEEGDPWDSEPPAGKKHV